MGFYVIRRQGPGQKYFAMYRVTYDCVKRKSKSKYVCMVNPTANPTVAELVKLRQRRVKLVHELNEVEKDLRYVVFKLRRKARRSKHA